jgi:uncharacterized protein
MTTLEMAEIRPLRFIAGLTATRSNPGPCSKISMKDIPLKTIVEQSWLTLLENELAAEMAKAPAVSEAHDSGHIHRVWRNAGQIAENLPVDWEVLLPAVYLHDLGRHYPAGSGQHGPVSAPLARQVLERIHFPSSKDEAVCSAIYYHDETFTSQDRAALEAKVLYDADKLDAFGAVGVTRSLAFYTRRGKTLKEIITIVNDNLPLRFRTLELPESRQVAQEMLAYTLNFFERLGQELG